MFARTLCAALAALAAGAAQAAANYESSYLTTDGLRVDGGFETLAELIGGLATVPPQAQLPQNFTLSLRRTDATLTAAAFPTGAAVVYQGQLTVRSLGIVGNFTGTSWSEVLEQMRAFLTKGAQAQALQREAARSSPFDPVAGNPASLMARVVAHDFASAFAPFASNTSEDSNKVAQAGGASMGALRPQMRSLPGVGAALSVLRDDGQQVKMLTLPLSYSLRSDLDPRRQFTISLPLALTDVNGARTTQGTLGATLRLPLARSWAVSTNLGYSMLSAKDLGTAGKIGSLSLTSSYVMRAGSGEVALGNLVGHYRTLAGSIGGVDASSGVNNTVFRNGLLWSVPAPGWLGGFGRSIETSFVNTHYTGSELYLRNYSELGVTLGSNRRADSNRGYAQGGLSYLFSSKTKGVSAHLGLWF